MQACTLPKRPLRKRRPSENSKKIKDRTMPPPPWIPVKRHSCTYVSNIIDEVGGFQLNAAEGCRDGVHSFTGRTNRTLFLGLADLGSTRELVLFWLTSPTSSSVSSSMDQTSGLGSLQRREGLVRNDKLRARPVRTGTCTRPPRMEGGEANEAGERRAFVLRPPKPRLSGPWCPSPSK